MHGETRRGTREFVGARIRAIRERRGMDVRTLSERSDIPEFMVRQMERGRVTISFENVLCLARGLGVPVIELFGDDEGDG